MAVYYTNKGNVVKARSFETALRNIRKFENLYIDGEDWCTIEGFAATLEKQEIRAYLISEDELIPFNSLANDSLTLAICIWENCKYGYVSRETFIGGDNSTEEVSFDLSNSGDVTVEIYERNSGCVNMYALKDGKVIGTWMHCEHDMQSAADAFIRLAGGHDLDGEGWCIEYDEDKNFNDLIAVYANGKVTTYGYGIQGCIFLDYMRDNLTQYFNNCSEPKSLLLYHTLTKDDVKTVHNLEEEVSEFSHIVMLLDGVFRIDVPKRVLNFCEKKHVTFTAISRFGCKTIVGHPTSKVCAPYKKREYEYKTSYNGKSLGFEIYYAGKKVLGRQGLTISDVIDIYNKTQE